MRIFSENEYSKFQVFGRVVLGLSQGSVSEIMNKPKPWHMLSIKGREPYIRMQLWLEDPHNVEKLKVAKLDTDGVGQTDLSKRMEAFGVLGRPALTPSPQHQASSLESKGDKDDVVVDDEDNGEPASKKPKVTLTDQQKEALRAAFAMQPFPNPMFIECFAKELGMETLELNGLFQMPGQGQKANDEANNSDAKSDHSGDASGSDPAAAPAARPSKRKAAAPQWVNPEQAQQDEKVEGDSATIGNSDGNVTEDNNIDSPKEQLNSNSSV